MVHTKGLNINSMETLLSNGLLIGKNMVGIITRNWISYQFLPTYYVYLNSQTSYHLTILKEAQWLSGRVLDLRSTGCGFEPHQRHCVVSLSKTH